MSDYRDDSNWAGMGHTQMVTIDVPADGRFGNQFSGAFFRLVERENNLAVALPVRRKFDGSLY